jgi:hypothetical protein
MADDYIQYEYQGIGLGKAEKYVGKKKFEEYCSIYHITAYSDLQLLEELIYREIMQERFKVQVEEHRAKTERENKKLAEDKQQEICIPTYVVEAMNQNLDQVLSLKEKLGLLNNQEGDDGFKYIQQLEDKFKVWCQENQDRTFACPHCSKMILLYMKQDYWETMKHPFFESKVLANKKLWELYKQGILTKQQVAEILGSSLKYIDWLEQKIYQRPEGNNETL